MNAVIIGASSGIGKALAEVFAKHGWELALTARRSQRLSELQSSLPNVKIIETMDVRKAEESAACLEEIFLKMRRVDVVILNAGVNHYDTEDPVASELDTVLTNAAGFAALARTAFRQFVKQGRGQLVGISSVACLRGSPAAPAYSASKAFVSNYMDGLRGEAASYRNIHITDVRPGFVETEMITRPSDLFWVASAAKAARQIYQAVSRKKRIVYVTKRWQWIAAVYRMIPDFIFYRAVLQKRRERSAKDAAEPAR